MTPLKLLGAPGSPYTRKMLALLRYRRIPYRIVWGSHLDRTDLPRPKVALLPTFYFENADGVEEAAVDSTPLIRRLETLYAGRTALPHDPALRFLDELIEDYADEWLTKAMFHYRWYYAPDIEMAGEILPRWRIRPVADAEIGKTVQSVRERQIGRLHVVGSNETTAPLIEASYQRFVDLLRAHLDDHSFLMGARPGASDFAAFGQLTQLTHFDPTPSRVALTRAPRVYAWVDVMEDLSGLEPQDSDWLDLAAPPATLVAILSEIGRCYVPVMLANARAIRVGASSVDTVIDGLPWVQQPFPYQARCLEWLRQSHGALGGDARSLVDRLLRDTGCDVLFA